MGDLVRDAARNNAEWCDTVCRLHGQAGTYHDGGWTVPRRPPPFYPDAVTLAPDAHVDAILAAIDAAPGCSVKDSFANLDLSGEGFDVRFEASWIHRPVDAPVHDPPEDLRWISVRETSQLRAWEQAWSDGEPPAGIFPSEVLHDDTVLVLAGTRGDTIDAGAIANLSGSIVGLSNVFTRWGDPDATWRGAIRATAARFGDLPLVGYERDDELAIARRCGFVVLGPLRVWSMPEPSPPIGA